MNRRTGAAAGPRQPQRGRHAHARATCTCACMCPTRGRRVRVVAAGGEAAHPDRGAPEQVRERNRLHLAMTLKTEANVLLLDEPTNDIDVNTLRALEEGILSFAGCAVVISHDRYFLDRICTHILAFEGNSNAYWFEGAYSEYEENKKKRLGDNGPKRIKYRKLTRG